MVNSIFLVSPVVEEPGCSSDNECPDHLACINRDCRDPCNCGIGAQCTVTNHRPICRCPPGYEGNPQIRCEESGCKSDSECPLDKACHQKQCINPCYIRDPCSVDAECYPANHRAQCRCRPGYELGPGNRCIPIGCRSNEECPLDKACVNRQCVDPCVYQSDCAPSNAECFVMDHRPHCRCLPGFIGDPRVRCERPAPEVQPECRVDSDCPSGLACINERCQNPCTVLSPCHPSAICRVINTVPVRTMICECPPGLIGDGYSQCGM